MQPKPHLFILFLFSSFLNFSFSSGASAAFKQPHTITPEATTPPLIGQFQSPLAIETHGMVEQEILDPSSALSIAWNPSLFHIFNTGQTLETRYDRGSFTSFRGQTYELRQFHFHSPAEHMVDGRWYPMEAHFVHTLVPPTIGTVNQSSGQAQPEVPHLLVVAVFFEEGPESPTLQKIWDHTPLTNTSLVPELSMNASDFLPTQPGFFSYLGSLTTAPFTEGVQWIIYREPVFASSNQLQHMESVFQKANNRPVQPLNGRSVTSSF